MEVERYFRVFQSVADERWLDSFPSAGLLGDLSGGGGADSFAVTLSPPRTRWPGRR